jgi:hypothetical protein
MGVQPLAQEELSKVLKQWSLPSSEKWGLVTLDTPEMVKYRHMTSDCCALTLQVFDMCDLVHLFSTISASSERHDVLHVTLESPPTKCFL